MLFDNARKARVLLTELRDQIARQREFISDPRLAAAQDSLETALSEITEAECALREEHYNKTGSVFA